MSVGAFFKGVLFVILVGVYIFSGGCAISAAMPCMVTGGRCDGLLGLFFVPGFIVGGVSGVVLAGVLSRSKNAYAPIMIGSITTFLFYDFVLKFTFELINHANNFGEGKAVLMLGSIMLLSIPAFSSLWAMIRIKCDRLAQTGIESPSRLAIFRDIVQTQSIIMLIFYGLSLLGAILSYKPPKKMLLVSYEAYIWGLVPERYAPIIQHVVIPASFVLVILVLCVLSSIWLKRNSAEKIARGDVRDER